MYEELTLFRLLVFVTVVDRGGYSAAAIQLNLTQPTVSYHVRALEQLFGTRLLLYSERRVHLTAEGQELYRAAQRMLHEGENLSLAIQHIRTGQCGRLRVGASTAFEQPYFFDRIIAPLCRLHSEVNLSLRFGESSALAEEVLARNLDLAYVLHTRLPAGLKYESLHSASLIFLVAPDHPLAAKSAVSGEDVAEAGIVAESLDNARALRYRERMRAAGLPEYKIVLEVDGLQARVFAARAGLGVIATFWPSYVPNIVPDGLQPLQLNSPRLNYDVGLVSRDEEEWTPIMSEFAAWLRNVTGCQAQAQQAMAAVAS